MTNEIVRSKRLRKKLYLDEFAILGFEFSYKISLASQADYDTFFDSFVDLIDSRDLFITIDAHLERFEGFVTTSERYGSTTEEDRTAVKQLLESSEVVSEIIVGELEDPFFRA
ncbi:MAG: hypothetical protein ACI9Y1_003199 [Lentisphaeria bacterium]|jgi:uncharacterized protein YggL (DUF469 family)